jgi:hypothetical protein
VYPVPELYSGALFFPIDRIAEVLHTWAALLPELPETMMTWANALHFPPLPELPDAFRGKSFAVVMAAFLGGEAEGRSLLRPVHALGPELDTFALQPPVGLGELAMDPPDPLPFRSAHLLLDELPSALIEDAAAIGGPGSALTMVQLRHMGGALARREPGAGARATLPGEVCLFTLAVVPDREAEPGVRSQLDALTAAAAPYRAGQYPNFVEDESDARAFFDRETWERLRRVKALYDPQDIFKGNHHIPPAA